MSEDNMEDNVIWLHAQRQQHFSAREALAQSLPEIFGVGTFSEKQKALLDAIAPSIASNPYRDPVDVEAIRADWLFLDCAIMDIMHWQEQLVAALKRAEEQT